MPLRLIRDEMLDSARVQKRSVEARWLFVAMMLTADDMGLLELGEFKLARRASLPEERIPALLKELAAADLIRPYKAEGKSLAFIPRFRQRLRIKRTKHPLPPPGLFKDDQDATSKINELQQICQTDDGQLLSDDRLNLNQNLNQKKKATATGKGVRGKGSDEPKASRPRAPAKPSLPPCPYDEIVAAYHATLQDLPAIVVRDGETWEKRKAAMRKLWAWILTSEIEPGVRRADTPEKAMDWMRRYFGRVLQSDWLMGRQKRDGPHADWKANFDYLMSERGRVAVLERA